MIKQLFIFILLLPLFLLSENINICSFNIQFLGMYAKRDNEALAKLIKEQNCDIVVIQELVAPPSENFLTKSDITKFQPLPKEKYDLLKSSTKKKHGLNANLLMWPSLENTIRKISATTTDTAADVPCPESKKEGAEIINPAKLSTKFFEAMGKEGFNNFIISDEDTSPIKNHSNGSISEWWVAFYNPDKVEPAPDLPHGFLSHQRVGNPSFDRVPYAFPFRSKDKKSDFVLISVHLAPGSAKWKRRTTELAGISKWIKENKAQEKDFIVLGDMNIEGTKELTKVIPKNETGQDIFTSLNAACQQTNTNPKPKSAKPYDHVMLSPTDTTEVPLELNDNGAKQDNFTVINLRDAMKDTWAAKHPGELYPGGLNNTPEGYDHNKFRTEYSDHQLIKFRLVVPTVDDDPSGQIK